MGVILKQLDAGLYTAILHNILPEPSEFKPTAAVQQLASADRIREDFSLESHVAKLGGDD